MRPAEHPASSTKATVAKAPQYVVLNCSLTSKKRSPVYVLKNGKPVATYPLTQTFDAI